MTIGEVLITKSTTPSGLGIYQKGNIIGIYSSCCNYHILPPTTGYWKCGKCYTHVAPANGEASIFELGLFNPSFEEKLLKSWLSTWTGWSLGALNVEVKR